MTSPGTSVGLRRRLVGLLAAFAVFAVGAATATIVGIQWRVEGTLLEFESTMGQTVRVDRLRVGLRDQMLSLRAVIDGQVDAVDPYFRSRETFISQVRQVAAFAPVDGDAERWPRLLKLANKVAEESDRCLALVQSGDREQANVALADRLESAVLPEIENELLAAMAALDELRNQATQKLATTTTQVLFLTVVVGVLAGSLVVVGAVMIRRWLIVPIDRLQTAAERYSRGDLAFRVDTGSDDELGALASTLNEMAQSLAQAQTQLQESESKHRLLFQNLRDAVVICDGAGRVVEYHDGETHLLGVAGDEHRGRPMLDVWPEWTQVGVDWALVIEAAVKEGRRFRAGDVDWPGDKAGESSLTVDLIVFRLEFGGTRLAAIVLRDVTERQRLQRKLRHAETMEAVGTLAGGLAHDFNNLLAGVIGSLSLLAGEVSNSRHADKIRSVVRTCWEAAGLSRRLLNFAGSAHGEPQVFCPSEAVTVIVDSLDPSFLEGVSLETNLDKQVLVRMDRDQFTQIVLNLVRNARDAMPDGGQMAIEIARAITRHPEEGRDERPFAVLVVADTGGGMTREVQSRIFEPFFTTKSRASRRGRGMGMAVAYSAVRNAGGFVQIDSTVGEGTTFRIHLPVCEESVEPVAFAPSIDPSAAQPGFILLVEEDAVLRQVCGNALQQWGYAVLAADGMVDATAKLSGVDAYGLRLAVIDVSDEDNGGLALAGQLIERAPDIRIIFTSAVGEQTIPTALRLHVSAQLAKPFELDALATAVSAALASSTPRT